MARELLHVVMGGGIVFAAYRRSDLAHRHAICITGATVASLELDKISPELRAAIEILDHLPPEIATDIATDWEHDDDVTPTSESTSGAESRTATKESPPLVIEQREALGREVGAGPEQRKALGREVGAGPEQREALGREAGTDPEQREALEGRATTKDRAPIKPTEESTPLTIEVSAIEDAPSPPAPPSSDDDPKDDPWEK